VLKASRVLRVSRIFSVKSVERVERVESVSYLVFVLCELLHELRVDFASERRYVDAFVDDLLRQLRRVRKLLVAAPAEDV